MKTKLTDQTSTLEYFIIHNFKFNEYQYGNPRSPLTTRLRNILLVMSKDMPLLTIDGIDKETFLLFRGSGIKMWNLFQEMINDFYETTSETTNEAINDKLPNGRTNKLLLISLYSNFFNNELETYFTLNPIEVKWPCEYPLVGDLFYNNNMFLTDSLNIPDNVIGSVNLELAYTVTRRAWVVHDGSLALKIDLKGE
jgi:hypothetical protein